MKLARCAGHMNQIPTRINEIMSVCVSKKNKEKLSKKTIVSNKC